MRKTSAARRALHQLIAERLQVLSAPERALVECAAFIAYRVDPAIVAACTGMTRESADAVLRRACDLDLLIADQRNPGRYRFRHALVRAAVDELADDEQAKIAHVRIAGVYGRAGNHADDSPERIITGTDGNLYFVANEPQTGAHLALGQLNPSGAFNYTAAVGTAGNFDDRLAYGADGNIWMTDVEDAEIIQFAGAITGYYVGAYNGVPETAYGLALGPDGALWFTTFDDNELGRITASGAVSFVPAPACGSACGRGGGIVLRGSALWYTLPGNRLAQDIAEVQHPSEGR